MASKAVFFASTAIVIAAAAGSASAADLAARPIVKGPIVVEPSHWTGFYAGVSAGGSWLKSDVTRFSSAPSTEVSTSTFADGVPFLLLDGGGNTNVIVNTDVTNQFLTGSEKGAVFTFTMGYNFVWNNVWLLGIQSEVSRDLSNTRLLGSTASSTTSQRQVPGSTLNTTSSSGRVEANLRMNWTVSEMARIGFIFNRVTLIYGLVGWSWSGFELEDALRINNGNSCIGDCVAFADPAFTLSGITYGGGVEHDFGWLRAFVQAKYIDYRSKDIVTPNDAVFTNTSTSPSFSNTTTTTVTGSDIRRISAHNFTITAGVNVPLNFWHP
jgi:outer membrane immunogenic protein